MASRYSQPQKGQYMQTYVSQHVPMPFEAIQRAIAQKNMQADAVASFTENAVQAAGKVKALEGADAEYVKAKHAKLQDFAASLTGRDLTDPEVIKEVRRAVSEYSGDQNLAKIESMYNKAKMLEDNIAAAKKSGDYTQENAFEAINKLNEYKTKGGFASGVDFDPTIEKGLNIFKEFSGYYAQLSDSGSDAVAVLSDGNLATAYKNGWRGIDPKRVSDQAKAVFHEAVTSQAGQQAIRKYKMLAGDKATQEGALKYVQEQLLAAGQGKIHGISSTNVDGAYKELAKSQTEAGRLEEYQTNFMEGVKAPKFENGQLKGSGTKGALDYMSEKGVVQGLRDWIKDNGLSKEEAEIYKPILIGAKVSGVSPEEYYNSMNKNISINTKDYVKAETAANASKIVWNGGGGKWHSMSVIDKSGKKTTMAEFVRQTTGIDPDKDMEGAVDAFKKSGFQISGELDANPYVAKGAYGNLGSKTFIVDYGFRANDKELEQFHEQQVRTKGVVERNEQIGGKKTKVYDIYDPISTKVIRGVTEKELQDYR